MHVNVNFKEIVCKQPYSSLNIRTFIHNFYTYFYTQLTLKNVHPQMYKKYIKRFHINRHTCKMAYCTVLYYYKIKL